MNIKDNAESENHMTQQEINILNFENELAASRQRLNNLIYEMNVPSNENTRKMMQAKIGLMTNELHQMENQLQLLRNSLETDIAENLPKPRPIVQPASQTVSSVPGFKAQTSPRQNKNTSLEDILGRNLMGIFASVLIFIGMVLFGMVIVPALSDEMKILCMYLASFSVIAVGSVFMKKSPANKFFISLTGLGIGGLFISLIMSNVYFHLFGDLFTYILLLIWAAGTILLSKFEHKLSGTEAKINIFEIIGQLGVMISVILGCTLCAKERNFVKFLMLVIYHFIAMTAFHIGSGGISAKLRNKSVFTRKYKVQNHVFKILTMLILILSYIICMIAPDDSYAVITAEEIFITLLLFLTITADLFIAYKEEKISDLSCMCYHASIGVYALLGVMLILQFGKLGLPEVLLSYALCVLLLLLTESQKNKYMIAAQIPLFLIALFSLIGMESAAGIIYLLLGSAPLMIIGIWQKSRTYLTAGTASLYLWAFGIFFMYTVTLQTVIAVILCAVIYLCIRNKTEEAAIRIAGYPIILITITMVFSTYAGDIKNFFIENHILNEWLEEIRHLKAIVAFSIAGIFHIGMTKKNSFIAENEKIMARVINAVIMLAGCSAVSYHEIPLLPILVAIGVFTLNSRELLAEEELKNSTEKKKYWVMAYILLKYTILLTVILNSFQTPEFMISISLLVFAVLSIVAGFWKRKKGYRLYGLVLSMISIFKLIMLDANMKDAVTGSVSFLICGLLCFAISFIYNKIQKEYFDDTKK